MENPFTEEYERDVEAKPVLKQWPIVLLDALEAMSLENIRDYQKELGFYIGLKERVKNLITAAHIDIILHLTLYKIEENCEDVTRYREWKKELI